VKKVYGMLSVRSNCPRAYMQMLARCRDVEDPNIDILNDPTLKINDNYNFWRYDEVLELNRITVNRVDPELYEDGDYLELRDNERNKRRKTISIYNEAERLNKHPGVFLNYLRMLAVGKGMDFRVIESKAEKEKKEKKPNYKVEAVLQAEDISAQQYEDLTLKKKRGETTSEENFQVERHFWQRYLATRELDEKLLKEYMFNPQLLKNFTSLIDIKNHEKQDNLRSANHQEAVQLVRNLLFGLGFSSPLDDSDKGREEFMTNFVCNICDDPVFANRHRINELFGLSKGSAVRPEWDSQHVLLWVNSILRPFSLKVSALGKHGEGYRLVVLHEMLELIARKNSRGKFYQDRENLLKQQTSEGDPFVDEQTGETIIEKRQQQRQQSMRQYSTSLLDVGVESDEE
jgi:hypothetical protein